MRRMLDPTEVGGGLPSTIEFDKDGNRTADKDLKVNGKLKLQSLVSNTNPDGDITKELGGGGGTKIIVQRNEYFNFKIEPGTYSRANPVIVNRYFSYAEAIINITTEKPYEPKGDMYADGIYWNVIWYADSNNIDSAFVVAYPTNGEHAVTKENTATIKFRLAYIPKA